MNLLEHSSADISDDGVYRYRLVRQWDPRNPSMVWVMLNPSTADADLDDPTIRRCRGFAAREGCGGIVVVNLFAYRATKPDELRRVADPVGPDNVAWIAGTLDVCAAEDGILMCGWGGWLSANNAMRSRKPLHRPDIEALARHRGLAVHHLGLTARGDPKHPLYIHADAPLQTRTHSHDGSGAPHLAPTP